jgi:hypothetical protein
MQLSCIKGKLPHIDEPHRYLSNPLQIVCSNISALVMIPAWPIHKTSA